MKTFDRWYIQPRPLYPIVFITLVNFCLLIVLMGGFYSFFASPAGIEIRMPRLLSGGVEESRATVDITAENVLYYNGKVVTLNDLKKIFSRQINGSRAIFIRADHRASLGRVTDVLDLCRGLDAGRVYVVTAPEK